MRFILILVCATVLQGCAAANRPPDVAGQLRASGLTVDEQNEILSVVFTALVTDLTETMLPAYLGLGEGTEGADPPPAVIAGVRGRSLWVEPRSAQPHDDSRGDGIPGTLVLVWAFRQLAPERVIVDTGVRAGMLAGGGYRFTVVKIGREWRIENKVATWFAQAEGMHFTRRCGQIGVISDFSRS